MSIGVSIDALIEHYGLLALLIGAGLEGEAVVITGGVLAHRGLLPFGGAMTATAAGSFLADQLLFLAGRRFRTHRWVRGLHAKPAFGRAIGLIERYPIGFIFAFRFLYGLRTISPIAIGTTNVRMRTYLLVNAASAIVWAITFTGIGYLFGHALEALLGKLLTPAHLAIAVGVIVASTLLIWTIRRWRRHRIAEGGRASAA